MKKIIVCIIVTLSIFRSHAQTTMDTLNANVILTRTDTFPGKFLVNDHGGTVFDVKGLSWSCRGYVVVTYSYKMTTGQVVDILSKDTYVIGWSAKDRLGVKIISTGVNWIPDSVIIHQQLYPKQ